MSRKPIDDQSQLPLDFSRPALVGLTDVKRHGRVESPLEQSRAKDNKEQEDAGARIARLLGADGGRAASNFLRSIPERRWRD